MLNVFVVILEKLEHWHFLSTREGAIWIEKSIVCLCPYDLPPQNYDIWISCQFSVVLSPNDREMNKHKTPHIAWMSAHRCNDFGKRWSKWGQQHKPCNGGKSRNITVITKGWQDSSYTSFSIRKSTSLVEDKAANSLCFCVQTLNV